MSAADLNHVVVAVTLVLLLAAIAVRVSSRAGLPSLLLYLAIGLAIGEAGLGVGFDDAELAQILGSVALALILADGGLTTRWGETRPVLGISLVLATVGVAISVAVTSSLAYLLLDVDVRTAVLLGAIASSTDAAAVFTATRSLRLRPHIRSTLEAESGFNDPPVIILVTLVTSDLWFDLSLPSAILAFAQQMLVGAFVGALVAALAAQVLSRIALPATGLYPLATLAFAMLAFGAAGVAGGSPFVGVYVAGLVLGNAALPHRQATLGFAEGVSWLSQIGLFVLLGLLASPDRLPDAVIPALIVGAVLTFVARPISVVLCATPFRFSAREQAFMSWAGLRGAVPIMLATLPITAGLPSAHRIFDVTFLLVVMFTLVQGPLLPTLSKRLGVVEPDQAGELEIESAPMEEIGATMLTFDVPAGSRLRGVAVGELRLPPSTLIAMILRDDGLFVPNGRDVLRPGDHLILATTEEDRGRVERRLEAVSRGGRLVYWLDSERSDRVGEEKSPADPAVTVPGR